LVQIITTLLGVSLRSEFRVVVSVTISG
jgi:hypothetical protein